MLRDRHAAVVLLQAAGLAEVLLRRDQYKVAADLFTALDAQPGAGQRLDPRGRDHGVAAFAGPWLGIGRRRHGELLQVRALPALAALSLRIARPASSIF